VAVAVQLRPGANRRAGPAHDGNDDLMRTMDTMRMMKMRMMNMMEAMKRCARRGM
jgi:hypothetical protein